MFESMRSVAVNGVLYYQCPECGYKQRSEATERIRCHRCDRSYQRMDGKQVKKTPDEGHGFATYSQREA